MEIITEAAKEVFEYLKDPTAISPAFAIFWETTRVIFLAISGFFLGLLIFLFFVSTYKQFRFSEDLFERYSTKPWYGKNIDKRWKDIVEQSKSDDEETRRLAIIEADDITNEVLSDIGYEGENLMEKVVLLNEDIIPNMEEIKGAHRRKRELVYNPNIGVSKEEAEKLISTYEYLLKDIEII